MGNQLFPHGRHIGMERVDYNSICREMFGDTFSSDLIPSESDQPGLIGLETFPRFSQNKPDLMYGDIRCLSNIFDLNLTTLPLFSPVMIVPQGGSLKTIKKERKLPIALT